MTENGIVELDKIVKWVKIKNNSEEKVNSISVSTHTIQGNYNELGEKMMFVLCLNRALVVKKYLASKLNDIQINSYACLDKVAPGNGDFNNNTYAMDEKRVEVVFNKPMPIAAGVHNGLSAKFDISASDKIIPNQYMKQNILDAINSYYANENVREEMNMCSVGGQTPPEHFQKIPKEFWMQIDNNLFEGEEPAYIFKNAVTTLMKKLDSKYKIKVQPYVLFHLEDKTEMKFEF